MRPVILLVASLIAATPVAARKTPRRPCAGGTFVLQGAPLVLGSSAAPVESVRVDPGRLTLGACAGPAKLRATRAGTRVAAKLSGCAGVTGKLKVAAMIAPSCAQIQGTARGKRKLHATFIGTLSRCGDGFVDAAAGEQCEPPGSATCDVQCQATTLPPDETLEMTPPGSPDGALLTETVDAVGATVTDAAIAASLDVPAGAFTGSAQVGVEPVTNTLDRALGDGVLVSSSASIAKPLIVRLPYDPATVDPDALRLAVHRSDGTWQELLPRAVDTTAHTIAAALRPPASASTTARTLGVAPQALEYTYWEVVKYLGFEMKPSSAKVLIGRQRDFTPYSRESHQTCTKVEEGCDPGPGDDDCLAAPVKPQCDKPVVVTVPFTNSKAGFTRVWYVNDSLQGDGTIGTAIPHGDVGATYTAPVTKPDPNVVQVEFVSINTTTNQQVSVKAPVTILTGYHLTGDWQGTQDDLCFCEVGDVTDHFELDLDDPGDGGALFLDSEPSNQASTVANQMTDPKLGTDVTCQNAGGFEFFTATAVIVVGVGESPTTWVLEIGGILAVSTCTETPGLSPPFTVPSYSAFTPGAIGVQFSDAGFTDGMQTLPDFQIPHENGRWRIMVKQQQ